MPPLPKEALDSGSWQISETEYAKKGEQSHFLYERYRADIDKPIKALPYEAYFIIKFKSPTKSGLFTEREEPAIKEFEDVLVREIQDSREGGIFSVQTLDGTREIIFYTQRNITDKIQAILYKCPAGYQYDSGCKFDPAWTNFFEMRKRQKTYKKSSSH